MSGTRVLIDDSNSGVFNTLSLQQVNERFNDSVLPQGSIKFQLSSSPIVASNQSRCYLEFLHRVVL